MSGGDEAAHAAEGCDGADEHATSRVVLLSIIGLFIGTALRFVETQLVPRARDRFGGKLVLPPYTLSVFLAGGLISFVFEMTVHLIDEAYGEEAFPTLHSLIASTQVVDPHVILLVLLPPLILESASSMDFHVFWRTRWQTFLLAFPGVVLQTFAVGAVLRYAFGYGEGGAPWSWDAALALGSIVSATDPVAVVSTLHALGAPERLSDVIDGESLLNDGSAMVLFLLFKHNLDAAASGATEPHTVGSGVAFFLRLSLGGVALGCACYAAVSSWLRVVTNDWRVEVGLLLLATYATFAIAELMLSVSGVLAVVTLGLLIAREGKYALSPSAAAVAHAVLPFLGHVAETVIFFVAGIAAYAAVHATDGAAVWWHALPLYLLLLAVRTLTVALLYPALSRLGYALTPGESAVIVYAGLRGAVGLALSLLVLHDELIPRADRERIHYLVASIVVLTMGVNGTSTPALFDALALYPAKPYRARVVARAIEELEGPTMERIRAEHFGQPAQPAPPKHARPAAAAGSGRGAREPNPTAKPLGGPAAAGDAPPPPKAGTDWLYRRTEWELVLSLVPSLGGTTVLPNDRLSVPRMTHQELLSPAVVRRAVECAQRALHARHPSGERGGAGARLAHSAFDVGTLEDPAQEHPRQLWRRSTNELPIGTGPAAGALPPAASAAPARRGGWLARGSVVARSALSVAPPRRDEELVETLFAALRLQYEQQYVRKQLDSAALGALSEALSSGEEYLLLHADASAKDALALQLSVLLYALPRARPAAWQRALRALPLLGEWLYRALVFDATFRVTEALSGFIRAHTAVTLLTGGVTGERDAVASEVLAPVLERAKAELEAHRRRSPALVTLQLHLLAARAVTELKRFHVDALLQTGLLTAADATQLGRAFDLALFALDTARTAMSSASRFARALAEMGEDVAGVDGLGGRV